MRRTSGGSIYRAWAPRRCTTPLSTRGRRASGWTWCRRANDATRRHMGRVLVDVVAAAAARAPLDVRRDRLGLGDRGGGVVAHVAAAAVLDAAFVRARGARRYVAVGAYRVGLAVAV